MNLEDRNIEDMDINEDYEMIPLEPMMYGYGQMNAMPRMGINPSMGMPMGYMQNVNSNRGMNPWMGEYQNMGMSPCMEMKPCMGMNQFNEGLYMNGFNQMDRMYGEVPMKAYDQESEELRQLDKYGDKDPYKDGYNKPNKFTPKYNDLDSIVRRIERYNPAIFRRVSRWGIPYEEAKDTVRRIVRLTLMYSEE